MPEYLISQHDPRGERSEQLAALKAAHSYDSAYGFPVAAGPPDGNGPSTHWQLRAIEEQELIRLNLLTMRRRGKWDFAQRAPTAGPPQAGAPPWSTTRTSAGFWTTSCPPRAPTSIPVGTIPCGTI